MAPRGGLGSPLSPLALPSLPYAACFCLQTPGPTSANVPVSLHSLPRRDLTSRHVSTHKAPLPALALSLASDAWPLAHCCFQGPRVLWRIARRHRVSLCPSSHPKAETSYSIWGLSLAALPHSLGKGKVRLWALPCVRGSQLFCLAPAPKVNFFTSSCRLFVPSGLCSAHLTLLFDFSIPAFGFSTPFLLPHSFSCCLCSVFFAGFPVHGVRGASYRSPRAPTRWPHSTPLPAWPAGGPHFPAPAQTWLRPRQLVMLTSVDIWLTQGSGHYLTSWRPWFGGENSAGAASPCPWDQSLLLQYPGPYWEGQGQSWAVDRGSVVPPLPWGH